MAVIEAGSYRIVTGENSFSGLSKVIAALNPPSIFILCDSNTLVHCVPVVVSSCSALAVSSIIEIEPGETSKSLEVCANIWQTLAEGNAHRNSLLVNIGGGVVTDLGGFCASVYKRGIAFVNIPTSLLAMADASVGGKTGIDHAGLKNIVGTFSNPTGVFINHIFLGTLPVEHLKNGMAEIIKMALVCDKEMWGELQKRNIHVDYLVEKAVRLKNKVVKKDPQDRGVRRILNFGHTVGHAVESATGYLMLHGFAIITGMIIETILSRTLKLMPKREAGKVITFLYNKYGATLKAVSFDQIMSLIANDKKNKGDQWEFVLLTSIGKAKPGCAVSPDQLQRAVNEYNTLIHGDS